MRPTKSWDSDSPRVQNPAHPRRSSQRLAELAKNSAIQNVSRLPCPGSDSNKSHSKRKRSAALDDFVQIEQPRKKRFVQDRITPSSSPEAFTDDFHFGTEVDWAQVLNLDKWPPETSPRMSETRANKRSRSRTQSSYNRSVREGSSPVAWTRRHAEDMQDAGLIMADYKHLAEVNGDCQKLCDGLLKKEYPIPTDSSFQVEHLTQTLECVQFRNEARIVRDITPILVPSPENLCFAGNTELADLYETINADWTQCDTLCGPRPKPDLAVGISPSAFSKEEKDKLRLQHTSACPNLFSESMYFPFLVCEVKQSDRPIEEAERQAMHSASIAVRAIIQLYKKTASADDVNQRVLAFSVAHNNSTVEMYGHFAKIDGEKMTFFRHRLFSGKFAAEVSSGNWTKAYQITRAIYETFYPKHLARIQYALSRMQAPGLASFTWNLALEGDSQDSTPSSQDESFRKPAQPSSTIKLQQENEKLQNRLLNIVREQQERADRQIAQLKEETQAQKAIMERQMAQQREQMERQMAQQREQMERQMEQQREQMERQMEHQREQMERQMAQQDQIITLMKESKSR